MKIKNIYTKKKKYIYIYIYTIYNNASIYKILRDKFYKICSLPVHLKTVKLLREIKEY